LTKPTGTIPNDLAGLNGARLVTASESEKGHRLATGLIKRVTGEDPITARFLHREYFTYTPGYKMILQTNNLPEVPSDDKAFWRRARLGMFTHVVPEGEEDRQLRRKLESPEHAQAVLAWCVRGCLKWQAEGLPLPERVRLATARYRDDVNWFGAWMEACCVIDHDNDDLRGTPTELLSSYNDWAKRAQAPLMNPKDFAEALRKREFQKRSSNGVATYRGICLGVNFRGPLGSPVAETNTAADEQPRISEHAQDTTQE
jgi:putative DNA primase/helicase